MRQTVITLVVGVGLGAAGAWFYLGGSEAEPGSQTEPTPDVSATLPDLPEPYYRVLFENEAVRIVEHRLETGEREPEHTHPPMAAYFVQGATAMITEADGSTSEATIPTGAFLDGAADPRLLEWWTHSLENTGDTPLHSILVEFKADPAGN